MSSYFEQLPKVVVRVLLGYVDNIDSRLALRLTCTTTKEWVTTKDLIAKIQVQIESNEDLEHWLMRYEDKDYEQGFSAWSNFWLRKELSQFSRSVLDTFFSSFQSQITKVHLSRVSASDEKFWQMVSLLRNLRALLIDEFDLSGMETGWTSLVSKTSGTNLANLTTFSVQEVPFLNPGDLRCWESIITNLALNTTHVTIPKPKCWGSNITWGEVKALQWILITEPMIYILRQNPRKIILNVKHLAPIHFGRLTQLTNALNQYGSDIYFDQVHPNHVKYVFLMSGDDHEEDFLGRIISLREKIDDRRPLTKWTGLEHLQIRTSRCDIRNYYDHLPQPIYPNLKTLEVEFDSLLKEDVGLLGLNRVITLLFKVNRPSVEELTLKWPKHKHDVSSNVIDLYEVRQRFPSLRKLVVVLDGKMSRII